MDVSPKPDTRNEEKRLFFLERKNQRTFSFGSEFPAGASSGKRRKVFLLFSSEKEALFFPILCRSHEIDQENKARPDNLAQGNASDQAREGIGVAKLDQSGRNTPDKTILLQLGEGAGQGFWRGSKVVRNIETAHWQAQHLRP